MRRYIYALFFALPLCPMAIAQSTDHNYVKTVTYLDRDGSNCMTSVQYYDGLGRPDQQVVSGANTSGKNLYTYTEYDGLGRAVKSWAPVVGETSLGYMSCADIAVKSQSAYSDSKGYSQTTYDALDRPLFVSTPGEAWYENHKGKTTEYCTNGAKEVRLITPNTLQNTKTYHAAGTLYGTRAWDEDGITTLTFKDMLGRVILERRGNEAPYADTYYVYNELNQLVYVLPPMYNEGPTVAKVALYAYQYSYDNRGRMISKTLPGCQPITYEYDNADRVTKMTDGVLRTQGLCRCYAYDNLGRLKTQCIYQGTTKQYDEIENYYDYDYSINGNALNKSNVRKNGIGQITATKQRTSNGSYILSTVIYDEYGRAIKQEELGLDNHLTTTEIEYNFVGNVTKSTTAERVSSDTILLSMVENTYAPHTKLPVSSLLYVTEYKGGKRQKTKTITMQDLSYNDLGRVIANNRSGNAGDIRYAYDDLHGWVTGINSGAGFEQRMYRENNGAHSRWDGSISAMSWRTDETTIHRYDYEYDGMNRLKKADYSSCILPPSVNNTPVVGQNTSSTSLSIKSTVKRTSSGSGLSLQSFIPATESVLSMSSPARVKIPVSPVDPIDPIWPVDPIDPVDPIVPVDDPVVPDEPTTPEESAGSRQEPLSSMEDLICDNLSFDNNQHYNEEIAYNANSSITTMKRYGMKDTKGFGLIDNLTFGYNGNRRTKVTDAITEQLTYEGCFDFVDGTNTGNDYAYNANGALTKDQNKGITKIEYDLLGNPKKVTMTDSRSIEYVYSADGRRLRAVHKSKISSEKTDYVGGMILKNGKPEMYRFSGGYASFDADTINGCHYYIADYLGNNRMVVNASTDEVEQVNHYYAYGGIIGNLSSNEGLQEFKFGDKELDRTYGLDLYDFEARQYDAITPWFTSIDPLAEKYYSISPYAYCAGDPVNCVDLDGRDVFKISKYGRIKNVAKVPGKTVLVFTNKEKVTSVLMFDSEKGYDQALNGMQSREFKNDPMFKPKTVTYGKMSAEQAMDLQDIMTKNTDVEWSAHTNQEGEGLLSTTHEEGTVQVDKAIEYSDFSEDESSLKMHGHPGRGDAEGTRGGSGPDIDKPSNGRHFVNHQGTGKVYEYKKGVQAVDSFGSYSEWKKKIFNKNKK